MNLTVPLISTSVESTFRVAAGDVLAGAGAVAGAGCAPGCEAGAGAGTGRWLCWGFGAGRAGSLLDWPMTFLNTVFCLVEVDGMLVGLSLRVLDQLEFRRVLHYGGWVGFLAFARALRL